MPTKRSSRKKRKKQFKSPGISGWAIIFLSIFIVVFLVSMFLPESDARHERPAGPERIRLQLLNGCGISGAAEGLSDAMIGASKDVIFDIIEKKNADAFNFENTLILDRKGGDPAIGGYTESAIYMANLLDVKTEDILIKKMAENILDIDITIIIGLDYETKIENLKRKVE